MKFKGLRWGIIFIVLAVAIAINYLMPLKEGLDLQGGMEVVLEAQNTKNITVNKEVMQGVKAVIENRVNGLGVSEPLIQLKGNNSVLVQLPGIKDYQNALNVIGKTAFLEFKEPIYDTATGQITGWKTVLTGADLQDAKVGYDSNNRPVVDITFNSEGAKKFAEVTANNIDKPLAIFLDNKEISAPIVKEAITGGKAQISGNFTLQSAKELAIQIKAGALPVPVKLVEQRVVGPTIGKDAVDSGWKAGFIGLLLVAIFMVLYYRLPGLIADLALVLYGVIVLAIFKFIPVTLTLPGIAGFILSIGMAVDANILIFERLKEELRKGIPLISAMDLGFKRALPAIIDSNASTLITTAVLFTWGSSIIKGFAVTLAIGVIVSFFTAVIISRALMDLVVHIEFFKKLGFYGARVGINASITDEVPDEPGVFSSEVSKSKAKMSSSLVQEVKEDEGERGSAEVFSSGEKEKKQEKVLTSRKDRRAKRRRK
ncbi:protein-export membrane protein SecD [Thermodesulfobium narugense DSM 14796]|uniref:Protein translocase subunit SecD n=1 Tax=Thermodesulfobium narugense DSM 14796 TaxID=747365 RepID=M1E629_9BACT|nr:protein translocase subunit SecD [Thermodesulfobium narugense]AEE13805.1 protein-export membrane protein SecD [Thermodesulfobium narugense DSM 14796]